ncbi:hypothetical protein RchiOBHm_Chr7g0211051 [Rosa chinensis]|uniref:Pre-rRNA-processing protein RIX1 N-terminal domain-containing protein n=2 Tax=Rosa chinensis TaxID=74649 RepID=A0A2P6PAD3_ROSCH|nr:proline-, glutamic acid- and leucine-rich protein 1 isoform X1 [Rosa chinensis]PRQ18884.1 hypothetical protein RchiOBHm_Chr7g0211051 [Rosa chinensis]
MSSAFDHVKDMHDASLKPRFLHTLIRDHLPDDNLPSRTSFDLSNLVHMIKTHNLLSESVQDPTDQKLTTHWRSAVDSWVDRLLLLVSSDMPDKCWAGICLLGVTCQECSSDRFLASYSVWYQKLVSPLQSPTTSQFVKVASCASMSDLLTRLGGFPLVKKDGTAHAGKLIPSVLKLLDDDHSEVVWEEAVRLLCIFISFFPISISRHYDSVEDAIASKILSGKCSFNMLKKLAHCLALIPKSKGDEESWSLMIQKILLSINRHLNDVFQGFEEETKRHEGIRLLVPPGKDPPPPLGDHTLTGEASEDARKRSHSSLVSSVSTLMICCSTMLTSSYPVQVTAPIHSLLALIERVLDVDGSLSRSLRLFMTAMQQEFVCSELPHLHSYSLDLLTAIFKGVRSQVLPHEAHIVHLLSVYLKRCVLPELRVKVYSITKILLISTGVGVGVCLAQEVVNSAFVDLNPIVTENSSASAKPSTEALLQTPQPSNRKRKHGTSITSLEVHNPSSLELGTPKNNTRCSISVQIAALEALEALLTVDGVFKSEGWRSDVDLLLINIATNSLKGGLASENTSIYQPNEPTDVWGDIQLAALRALLASFLSSSRVRPPYLAQGVDLFRRGKLESGTKLAEFCAHALLVLEVLIHPRALPLADFSNTTSIDERVHHKYPGNIYSGSLKHRTSHSTDMQGTVHDAPNLYHDELYSSWIETSKEMVAPGNDLGKTMQIGEPSKIAAVHGNQIISADASLSKENEARREKEIVAATIDYVKIRGNGDDSMVEPLPEDMEMEQYQGVTNMVADPENSKGFAYGITNDSDTDSIPDIVDVGPDSDSE